MIISISIVRELSKKRTKTHEYMRFPMADLGFNHLGEGQDTILLNFPKNLCEIEKI